MYSLALCSLSAYAQWVLIDENAEATSQSSGISNDQTGALKASIAWSDENSRSLSDSLRSQLETLLNDQNLKLQEIKKLYVFTGPGAFTGLRMSVSFALGLSKALRLPIQGVSTYSLFQKAVWIPTRHQMAKKMSLSECLENGMEFLEVYSEKESRLSTPPEKETAEESVLGLSSNPNWPQAQLISECVLREAQKNLEYQELEIQYGLNPKISGQRHPV